MAELAKEFFERDLSEKELDRLQALLEDAEEHSLRFAGYAADFYASLGLPEFPPRRRWRGASFFFLLVGLGVTAWFAKGILQPLPRSVASVSQLPYSLPRINLPPASATAPVAKKTLHGPGDSLKTDSPRIHEPSAPQQIPEHPTMALFVPTESVSVLGVSYHLPKAQELRLRVMDPQGRQVGLLFEGASSAGEHRLQWDGISSTGPVAPGVYAVELETAGQKITRRVRIDER